MKKKFFRIFLVAILVVGISSMAFVGCKEKDAVNVENSVTGSESESSTVSDDQQSSEKPKLVLWEWHMSEIPDIVGKLYEQFEEKYNVDLVVETLPWGEVAEKYMLASESGNMPDLCEMWAANLVPTLAEKGLLENLNSYVEKDNLKDYFIDSYLTRYKGNLYSLPIYVSPAVLYYNKTLFTENGLQNPPKDWDELLQFSQKLTDSSKGQYGIAMDGADSELLFWLVPFIAQNGGQVGLADGKIQINSKETVEALQFVVDLISKYKVVASYTTYDSPKARDAFMSGKIGMLMDGSWGIGMVLNKEPNFEWGTATLPMGKMDGTGLVVGDTEYGMSANSKNKDLCWEFLKFMTSEESNYFWCKTNRNIPTVKSVSERIAKEDAKNDVYLKAFYDQMDKGNAIPYYNELPPQLEKAADIFKQNMHSAVLGEKTVQEAMDTVSVEWDKLVQEWVKDYGAYTR